MAAQQPELRAVDVSITITVHEPIADRDRCVEIRTKQIEVDSVHRAIAIEIVKETVGGKGLVSAVPVMVTFRAVCPIWQGKVRGQ